MIPRRLTRHHLAVPCNHRVSSGHENGALCSHKGSRATRMRPSVVVSESSRQGSMNTPLVTLRSVAVQHGLESGYVRTRQKFRRSVCRRVSSPDSEKTIWSPFWSPHEAKKTGRSPKKPRKKGQDESVGRSRVQNACAVGLEEEQ